MVRERACAQDLVLRPAKFRRRDHFHGLGNLLRRLDGAYTAADVEKGGHRSGCFGFPIGRKVGRELFDGGGEIDFELFV